jgi:Protein of unknown function (DUF4242)
VTNELLAEALNRERQVMRQMCAEGTRVHHLTTILIPAEDVAFALYEAPSTAEVLRLNQRAAVPVSRIVEAILVKEPHR